MAGILPPMSAVEALETSMIHSIAGLLSEGGISFGPDRFKIRTTPPPQMPSPAGAKVPSLVRSVSRITAYFSWMSFLNFRRQVLETLRQPMETGDIVVARANAHIRYPCRFLLDSRGQSLQMRLHD